MAGLGALPGAWLAFIKYSRALWKTSRGPARRREGGHSNRRTSSANPPPPLLFLSPYSYAPVSFSQTQVLTVNICLISLFKSPLSLLVSHPLCILCLPRFTQHPIAEVQPELPCFQMTQQHWVYIRELRFLFHMSMYYEAKPTLYYWPDKGFLLFSTSTAQKANCFWIFCFLMITTFQSSNKLFIFMVWKLQN